MVLLVLVSAYLNGMVSRGTSSKTTAPSRHHRIAIVPQLPVRRVNMSANCFMARVVTM